MSSEEATVLDFEETQPNTTEEISASSGDRDITKAWIDAMEAEPNPDYVMREEGLDLNKYAEILTDDQVFATFQQRRQAVTSREWDVEPGEEGNAVASRAADLMRKDLSSINWDRITDLMLYGTFFGYSVGEIMWEFVEGHWKVVGIKVRDRARFAFAAEDRLLLLTPATPQGETVPREKFWCYRAGADHVDNPYGKGLAHYLFWPAYFKRQGLRFWLTFLDKFGMPTLHGKLAAGKMNDKRFVRKALNTLMAVQTDSAIVTSEEMDVSLLEGGRAGRVDYDALQERLNAAISKIVLSQTMTTDPAGGQYKGDVHKSVRDEVLKSDADMLCASFNEEVARQWTDFNFGTNVPAPKVWRRTEDDVDLNEVAERDKTLKEVGWVPTPARMLEVYGEGYEPAPEPPPPPPAFGGPAGESLIDEPSTPADFEELQFAGYSPLLTRRMAHRVNQSSINVAAEQLGANFDVVLGRQVRRISALMEDSTDLADFANRLPDLIAEDPNPVTVETIHRAQMFARVMGLLQQLRTRDDGDK